MAIYHLSLKNVQRSKGRSATAASAYRSRAKITDQRTGQTYDYRRKKGVEAKAIFTPDGTKITREELWNLAEASEKRKDAITAREYELALPSELDGEGRKSLVQEFCEMLMNRYGVAVDVALHNPTPESDQRNFHAHIMVTTRKFSAGKLGEKSDFDLSGSELKKRGLQPQKSQLEDIREKWGEMVNTALEAAGSHERVTHHSHQTRGFERSPTVHMGVAATAMERKGIATDRGELNRRPVLRRLYGEFIQVKKSLRVVEAELAEMRKHREGAENGLSERRRNADNSNQRPIAGEASRTGPETRAGATRRSSHTGTRKAGEKGQERAGAGGTREKSQYPAGSDGVARPVQTPKDRPRQSEMGAGGTVKAAESPGRADIQPQSPSGGPETASGRDKRDFRYIERVSAGSASRRLSGGPGRGRENQGHRGGSGDNLGVDRGIQKTPWLDGLAEATATLKKRIIEYRTIGDLLSMAKTTNFDHEQEQRQTFDPDKP